MEHAGLYDEAVAAGRAESASNPASHFVDDESSRVLFLGYSAAAFELRAQLAELNIEVSPERPLVVHVPCGVGGAPGGLCWGMHLAFGAAQPVRVFFAEPVAAPCVTLALCTGKGAAVCVADIGLDGKTEADGLAVGRASALCFETCAPLVEGSYTIEDCTLFEHLGALVELERSFIEPSCCACFAGPGHLAAGSQRARWLLAEGTHVFWATGGSLVPEAEREALLARTPMGRQ